MKYYLFFVSFTVAISQATKCPEGKLTLKRNKYCDKLSRMTSIFHPIPLRPSQLEREKMRSSINEVSSLWIPRGLRNLFSISEAIFANAYKFYMWTTKVEESNCSSWKGNVIQSSHCFTGTSVNRTCLHEIKNDAFNLLKSLLSRRESKICTDKLIMKEQRLCIRKLFDCEMTRLERQIFTKLEETSETSMEKIDSLKKIKEFFSTDLIKPTTSCALLARVIGDALYGSC